MADELNEGNQVSAGGADANPTPSATPDQPLDVRLAELNSNLDKALKKLDAQAGEINALKSGKDKAVNRAIEEIQPLKETIARLAKYLNIPEADVMKAQRDLILDDLVNERMGSGTLPKPSAEGTVGRAGNAVELQIIDELLELPINDSRVTQLKLAHGNDVNAYKEKAKELKKSLAGGGTPSPAEGLPVQGTSPRPQGTDALVSDYKKEMYAARGKPTDLNAIKNKYAKLGVNIHEVTFS